MTSKFILNTKNNFPNLTKGLKKVGDSLLSNPSIFATHSSKQIGEIIGVSETMVIRFSKSIGYDGFYTLQKDVINYLLTESNSKIDDLYEENNGLNNFEEYMTRDVNLLNNNIKALNTEQLETIVETFLKSERIVIAGYYQSFSFAHWLFFNLNYTMGNASLYRPETDALVFEHLPKDSCVVIFSFSRYALDTIRFAEDAKKKGIKVIAFTDSRVSPIMEHADVVVLVEVGTKPLLEKGPVTLSIINSILSEVINRWSKNTITETEKFKYFLNDDESINL